MQNWNHKNLTIHQFEELESTNLTAFDLANSNKIFDREIILADVQTAGKGRQSRSWISPKGNLYFSLVLQPKITADKIPQLSFVAITALRQMIENQSQKKIKIQNKWPNDLLINEKKVAGLLLSSKISQKDCEFVILGIGLNLSSNPDQTMFPASNLKENGINLNQTDALKNFLNEFEKLYENWLNYGFSGIRKLWLNEAYRLNEKISVRDEDKALDGIFEDLDDEGNLILGTENGIKKISASDIF